MKITSTTRFPWPVLWSETTDYVSEGFSGFISRIEEDTETGQLNYDFQFTVADPALHVLVQEGKATLGFYVTCTDTMFDELRPAKYLSGNDLVPAGKLRGSLTFTPVCWTTDVVPNYSSPALNPEYNTVSINLPRRALVAIGPPTTYWVGSEKAVAITSIFELAISEEQEDFNFGLQIDGDTIVILCNERTKRIVDGHRATVPGQALMLNALYLPVLVQVLVELKARKDQADGLKWARVLLAKIESRGKVLNDEYLTLAQDLLEAPFKYLESIEARTVQ